MAGIPIGEAVDRNGHFGQFLIDANLSTDGARDFTGGGVGSTEFALTPTAGQILYVAKLTVVIVDAATLPLAEYGATGGALANGYELQVLNAAPATEHDLTDGVAITTNACLYRYPCKIDRTTDAAGNNALQAVWDFSESGSYLKLRGTGVGANAPARLALTLQDDCSGLVAHTFFAEGFRHLT